MAKTRISQTFFDPDITDLGTAPFIRFWYQGQNFIASDGVTPVIVGNGQTGFFIDHVCSIVSGRLLMPFIDLWATTTGMPATSRFIGQLYSEDGVARDILFGQNSGWQLPTVYGPIIAYDELATYNRAAPLLYAPASYFTADQTIAEIRRLAGNFMYANVGVLGIIEADTAPDDPAHPTAVMINSPVIPAFTLHTSKYASFNLAVTAINSLGGGTVIVDSASPVTVTIIVPSTVQVLFQGQGQLTGTATVNFVGPMTGPPRQLFASGITVTFTNSLSKGIIYPQWWGVSTAAVDNIIPLTACIASAKTGARSIHFLDGTYYISDTAAIQGFQGYYLSGENKLTTQIVITTANKTGVLINHGSYGVIDRLGFSTTAASTNDFAVLDIDSDGSISALSTQQISLRDVRVYGARLAQNGLRISASGGSAQGDTILLSNILLQSCMEAGLRIGTDAQGAGNALGIKLNVGNIQDCPKWGIKDTSGQVMFDTISFQNQNLGLISADGILISQITNGGADYFCNASSGASSISAMTDIRSESDVLVGGGPIQIRHAAIEGASQQLWFADSYYNLGQLIKGTAGVGQKGQAGRTFMLVDQGGGTANFTTPSGTSHYDGTNATPNTIIDLTQSWTINEWVGFYVALRYPNGFIAVAQIASNTATVLTLTTPLPFDFHTCAGEVCLAACGLPAQAYPCSQYKISAVTGSTEPTWSSAPQGFFNGLDTWICTAGSNVVDGGYYDFGSAFRDPVAGDYIMIVGAGTDGGPFISEITAFSHPTGSTARVTLANNVVTGTPDGTTGYLSTPLTDGGVKWIDIDFLVVTGAKTIIDLYANGGKLGASGSIKDSIFIRPDFLVNANHNGTIGLQSLQNTGYAPGNYNVDPVTMIPDFAQPGADVTAANTINPTGGNFNLTGTTTVKTITMTGKPPGTTITIKCTGAASFDETGNIKINGVATTLTVTAGDIVTVYWDGTVCQLTH